MSVPEPIVVSYGGGTNSTAMLVGLAERGIRPDAILFADTGGEKPATLEHLMTVQLWLEKQGFPSITVVRANRQDKTLEDECIRKSVLPSLAYGYKKCSQAWKIQPQDKWLNHWPRAQETWAAGKLVVKVIGYDAGERHRAARGPLEDKKMRKWFPLLEWDWAREECIEAIDRAGLPRPGKSACFYCPASTKKEVLALAKDHPDLFERAAAMEAGADLVTIRGLGRRWRWRELVDADRRQLSLFPEPPQIACGCFDGDDD